MADDDRLAAIEARLAAIEAKLSGAPPDLGPPPPAAVAPPPPIAPMAAAEGGGPTRNVESIIGAHLLNRIGIAALLIGVAFFLKYAFENAWIGPAARIAIGVAAGCALLVWSELLHRRGHVGFGHSIRIIAVGVLYLSIWAASQTYELISNGTAFGAMFVVTASLVALAVRHRSEFIAGVALTAGFLTPVLLSTGANRPVALFTYVALLDLAAIVFVALYPWGRALSVAFFGTLGLYIGWYSSFYTPAQFTRTLAFAALFFVLFSIQKRFHLLPFANAFAFFMQLTWLINDSHRLGRYAIALAALYLIVSFIVMQDVHLAIAIGFLTVAIPLQLDASWITLGWYAEAAVLLAMSRRSRVFETLGSMALGLAVTRMLWIDRFQPQHILLNQRALLYAIAVAIFAGIAMRARSERLWRIAVTLLNVLALIGLTAEVRDALKAHTIARQFGWSALWMGYGAMLMAVGFVRRKPFLRWLALILIGATVAKVFLFDLAALERVYRILSFIALGVILLAISFAYQKKWITMPDEP